MKKFLSALCAAILFGGSGCSGSEGTMSATAQVSVAPQRVLVAYYSYSGNTRAAAQAVHQAVGGTLLEIKPAQEYPADYNRCVEQAKKECREGFCPPLATAIPDMSAYDVVFVGTPNWWSTMAPPVRTFLSQAKLSGKTVIPFVTHGGGGMARCERDMPGLATQAKFLPGRAFSGSSVRAMEQEIGQWAKGFIAPAAK